MVVATSISFLIYFRSKELQLECAFALMSFSHPESSFQEVLTKKTLRPSLKAFQGVSKDSPGAPRIPKKAFPLIFNPPREAFQEVPPRNPQALLEGPSKGCPRGGGPRRVCL